MSQTTTGVKFDYLSGYTADTVGFGLDVQAVMGINLTDSLINSLVRQVKTSPLPNMAMTFLPLASLISKTR